MSGNLYYWVADWNLSRAQAAIHLGNKNVADMVDCTHDALPQVRATSINRFAGYVTGTPDICWTPADFTMVESHGVFMRSVLRIDQTNLDLPLKADVKLVAVDVEQGAASIATAVTIAHQRIPAGEDLTVYCSEAILHEVEQEMNNAGFHNGRIVAYQWASPTSNPNTILPGTNLTLKEANADLSVVDSLWMPLPQPVRPPEKLPRAVVTYDPDDFTWQVTNYPWGSEPAGK